jgi:hypothetical protein
VDFCGGNIADTPIIDDSNCTVPTGFSVGTPTVNTAPTITGYTNLGGTWTSTAQNTGRTLRMVSVAGASIDPANATPYTFVISTVTNTSTVGTFYARIITYTSDTGDVLAYTSASAGSTQAKDYGGFALSTNNVISITAKVQESLQFCVSGLAPGTNCGTTGQAVTPAALTLGHGPANILDSSPTPDTATAFTQLSTNANGGAVIRMKNTAVSGGLNSGTNSIPPVGATAAAIVGGTAAFGVKINTSTGGTGTVSPIAPYNTANYGMDATTTDNNVLATFGSSLASSAAPVNNASNTLTFAATASNTTPAGLYTANIILVAVGTF